MKSYKIYYQVENLPDSWDGLVAHDIFFKKTYLKALETASPSNMQTFYVGVFNEDALVGCAIIQRVQLYLKDMFRTINVSCIKGFFRDAVSKVLKGNILVVGNLSHTGQHGLFFQKEKISQTVFLNVVCDALETIKSQIKANQNKTIRIVMFKDYFLDDSIHSETPSFHQQKLHKVQVQPNMVLKLQPNWLSLTDYVNALTKKYRSRYRTARKKLDGIQIIEIGLEAIKTHENTIHKLYLNVSNHAKFNTFILPENHFFALKLQLENRFRVFGYFLKDQLIGFFTLIENEKQLETYFLGYEEAFQYKNQLYLNMLYAMLEYGINNRFESIVYARTAMEIKSSIGAKPKPMLIYIKHTNSFINAIFKQVFKFMNLKQTWEERHPFSSN